MLANSRAYSGLAVHDLQEARRFYGETLGLGTSQEYGLMWLHLAGGPGHPCLRTTLPGQLHGPQLEVDDIDAAVSALAARRVRFERYDGLSQDENGIFRDEGLCIAWFKDPSGNVLAVLQEK
jgi:catechol 2,3-dioxygenase-like lactoylglutathione lyase family enzyme